MEIIDKNINRKGLMFVLSSPSGAGKTSLSRKILELDDEIFLSVSYTTRPSDLEKWMEKIITSLIIKFLVK